MVFPQTANPIQGELYVGSLGWVDITSDIRQGSANSGGGITITRGRSSEGRQADPGRCSFVLNNRHGKYSPRNPRSEYYGLIGRNTPARFFMPLWSDTFSRTVVGGLGTSDSGLVWNPFTPSAWSVNGSKAVLQFTGAHEILGAALNGSECLDSEQVIDFTIPAVMTGASLVAGLMARYNAGNFYWLRTEFDVGGVVRVKISAEGTSAAELGVADTGVTYSAGSTIRVRAAVVGHDMSIKVWNVADPEPADWHLSVSDHRITAAGRVGMRHWLVLGNTNSPVPSVSADNYSVTLPRFLGEISEWPAKWDLSGNDVWVPVEASGILRRLNQGSKPLSSPLFKTLSRYSPTVYLPLEDGSDSSQPTNAVAKGLTVISVDLTPSADDTLPGATTSAKLGSSGSSLHLRSANVSGHTYWSFLFFFKMDSIPSASGELLKIVANGRVAEWTFSVSNTEFRWTGTDTAGATVVNLGAPFNTDVPPNEWVAMQLQLQQDGSNSKWTAVWHQVGSDDFSTYSGSPFTYSGKIGYPVSATFSTRALPPTALGHVAAFPIELPMVTSEFRNASNGYIGETAGARIQRLGAEAGIPVGLAGDEADTALMGRQKADTFLNLLQACAAADGGILREQKNGLGLVYRARTTFYNQPAAVEMSYASGHISEPFEPVEDDDSIRNDVTVSREDGGSSRYALETGPLSIQAPPDGVGVYDESVTLNLASDSQTADQASWRVHLGTVDEARYPRVRVNLARAVWSTDQLLTMKAAAVDSGDLVSIDDLPDWLPPGPVKLIIQGYTERIDAYEWSITWNATPGSPWTVGVYDDATLGRVDADGSTVVTAVNATATSITVTAGLGDYGWITTATEPSMFPFDVLIAGERMTVTACSASGSNYVFTVTRSVNGIVKSQAAGAEVHVADPAVIAL